MAPRKPKPRIVAAPPPVCLECGATASLVMSQSIYPRRPDLWNRPMWQCRCGAYTGCHQGTENAKGNPAGKETRDARRAAHAAFDRLWQLKVLRDGISRSKARGAGYKWLAETLGIERKRCHIAMMDRATALRVVEVCTRRKKS